MKKNKQKKSKKDLHREKIMKAVADINKAIKKKRKKKKAGKEDVVTVKIVIKQRKETVYRTNEIRRVLPKRDKDEICFTPYAIRKKKGGKKVQKAKKIIYKNISFIQSVQLKKKKKK